MLVASSSFHRSRLFKTAKNREQKVSLEQKFALSLSRVCVSRGVFVLFREYVSVYCVNIFTNDHFINRNSHNIQSYEYKTYITHLDV